MHGKSLAEYLEHSKHSSMLIIIFIIDINLEANSETHEGKSIV